MAVAPPKWFSYRGHEEKKNDPTWVWMLTRSLYGLREASRWFSDHLTSVLVGQGYTQSKADAAVFYNSRLSIVLCTYVDDLLFLG